MAEGLGDGLPPSDRNAPRCHRKAHLRGVGLVTRTGSMEDAAPRIARVIQSVAREVFAGSLILETV